MDLSAIIFAWYFAFLKASRLRARDQRCVTLIFLIRLNNFVHFLKFLIKVLRNHALFFCKFLSGASLRWIKLCCLRLLLCKSICCLVLPPIWISWTWAVSLILWKALILHECRLCLKLGLGSAILISFSLFRVVKFDLFNELGCGDSWALLKVNWAQISILLFLALKFGIVGEREWDILVLQAIFLVSHRGVHHLFFKFLLLLLELQLKLLLLFFIKLSLISWDFSVKHVPEYENLVVEAFKSAPKLGVLILHFGQVYRVSDVLWQPPVSFIFPMIILWMRILM